MKSIDTPSLILNNPSSVYGRNVGVSQLVTPLECSKLEVDSINLLEKKDSYYESFLLINEKEQLKVNI